VTSSANDAKVLGLWTTANGWGMIIKHKVTCPCCKGEKTVVVWEPGSLPGVEMPTVFIDIKECGHCEGTGEVDAEVPEGEQSGN
jgi:hypothetical protein